MTVNHIFPPEIQANIFSRLNKPDQEQCRLVCAEWNRTIVCLSNSRLRASFEKVLQSPCLPILAATSIYGQFSACHTIVSQHLTTHPDLTSSQLMLRLTQEAGPCFAVVKLLRASSATKIEETLFNNLRLGNASSRDLRRFAQVTSEKVCTFIEKELIQRNAFSEAERLVGSLERHHPDKRALFEQALVKKHAIDYLLDYRRRVKVTPTLLQQIGECLIKAERIDEAEQYAQNVGAVPVEYSLKKQIAAHFIKEEQFERVCTFFAENFPSHYLAAYESFFADLVKAGQSARAWQFCEKANKDTLHTLLVKAEVEAGHPENGYRAFSKITNRLQKMKAARLLTYYEARVGNIQRAYEFALQHLWKSENFMKKMMLKVHLFTYSFARSVGA